MDRDRKREVRQRRKKLIKMQNKLRNGVKLAVLDAALKKKEERDAGV